MAAIHFVKMHGLGNDFVVIDAREQPVSFTADDVRAICARRTGIGCDQLIVIEPGRSDGADAFMRIHNADGGEVGACGNAMRCVASMLMAEGARDAARIETRAGVLLAEGLDEGLIAVDMGVPGTGWEDIPLAEPADTLSLDIADGPLTHPVAVSMGNPHAVFFVDDAEAVDLATLGPRLEHHPLFPERANIGVAQVVDRDNIRLRVWERGAGLTAACGTGACAAAVAAARRNLAGRKVSLHLDGGDLMVEWRGDGHVLMVGPAAVSFAGDFEPGAMA